MKKYLVFFFCSIFFALSCFADWEELSEKHYKKRVGNKSPEAFVKKEIIKLTQGNSLSLEKIQVSNYGGGSAEIWVPVSARLEKDFKEKDYLTMSTIPHLWVKRNLEGEVVEFGSSFLLPRDSKLNPDIIEQEIFYFTGEKKNKAFIANW
jgi:hypothetical protein